MFTKTAIPLALIFPQALVSQTAVYFKIATAAVGLRLLYKNISDGGLIGDKPFAGLRVLLLAKLTTTGLNHIMFPCVKMTGILTHIHRLSESILVFFSVGPVSYKGSAKSVCFLVTCFR